jgi:hypothetical protein
LRELLEHKLGRAVHLSRIGEPLGPTADRQTTDVVPACVR